LNRTLVPCIESRRCGKKEIQEMFSEAVLDHFRQPRNAGSLAAATHTVEVSNPVCGDVLRLAVRMEGERIAEARFLCRGCTTAIAAASLLTERLLGGTRDTARTITADVISDGLGGLPPATQHGAQLAESAVGALLGALLAALPETRRL
jgi:nitrogen fixation protein NifU and related proteins